MGARTVVADVADELAQRVVSGLYAPGDLMPSVREVADEFEMNRATAQLVLARVESYGFADARRGKGFIVRDIRREGGVQVFGRLFRLSLGTPEAAAAMFGEIVAEERAIVLNALIDYTESTDRIAPESLKSSVDELEALAKEADPDYSGLLTLELRLVRRILTALDSGMQRAMLNSIGEMVLEVPEAVAAYYAAGPDLHVLVWRALLAIWESETGPSESQLALFEDLFEMYHQKVLDRFAESLGVAAEPAELSHTA